MKSEKQEKLEQLSRILQSRAFRGSENLKTFLKFIVHAALDDQAEELKEYTIANEVFRNSKYDSRIDSTVRVQAGRLRAKLEEYYSNGGTDDKWVIELPKGHYIPVFRTKDQPPIDEPVNDKPEEPLVKEAERERPVALPLARQPSLRRMNWLVLILALTCAGALFMALSYRSQLKSFQSPLVPLYFSQSDVDTLSLLWKNFLERGRPVIIVYSSNSLEKGAKEPLEALPNVQPNAKFLYHYTGTGEVMAVGSLSRLFTRVGKGFRVKRGEFLAWDDVKTENIVILGERDLFSKLPRRQTFAFRSNPDETGVFIANLSRQGGEAPTYSARFRDGGVLEDFAVVSLTHGLGENNHLLMLTGTTTFGTQAAAEYVTNPTSVKEFAEKLKSGTGRVPESFDALVKVVVTDGVPVEITYVTHHTIQP